LRCPALGAEALLGWARRRCRGGRGGAAQGL